MKQKFTVGFLYSGIHLYVFPFLMDFLYLELYVLGNDTSIS